MKKFIKNSVILGLVVFVLLSSTISSFALSCKHCGNPFISFSCYNPAPTDTEYGVGVYFCFTCGKKVLTPVLPLNHKHGNSMDTCEDYRYGNKVLCPYLEENLLVY